MEFLVKYIVQIDFDNKKVTFFKSRKDIDLFFFLRPKENKHPEWGEPIPLKKKGVVLRPNTNGKRPTNLLTANVFAQAQKAAFQS